MDPIRDQITSPLMNNICLAMNQMRLLDPEIPGQVMFVFFYVAAHNKCHKQAIEQDLKLSVASASRACDYLSAQHRLGKPGLNLIEKRQDPSNRRRIELHLTNQGEVLADQIKEILYGMAKSR